MKILEFTTSKGDFALMDGKEQIDQTLKALLDEYTPVAKVGEMTEEQFGEVVDKLEWSDGYFMYYRYDKSVHDFAKTWTAKDSFLSLVLSLGWYLWENPVKLPYSMSYCSSRSTYYGNEVLQWRQAEYKTFYSPVLLKMI